MRNQILILLLLIATNTPLLAISLIEENLTIENVDQETGVVNDPYSTSEDDKILTLGALSNLGDFASLTIFEAEFSVKVSKTFWLKSFFDQGSGTFSTLLHNHEENSVELQTDEARFQRPETTRENFISVGIGPMARFWFLGKIISSDSIFETSSAAVTYTILDEAFRGEKYAGLGLRADYGIGYRFSSAMELGTKFSYHIAALSRAPATAGEPSSARSLTMSWFALGLETKFYF